MAEDKFKIVRIISGDTQVKNFGGIRGFIVGCDKEYLPKLLHIRAWGHPTLPDLDYETDDRYDLRYKEYPYTSIALQRAVSHSMLSAALEEENGRG